MGRFVTIARVLALTFAVATGAACAPGKAPPEARTEFATTATAAPTASTPAPDAEGAATDTATIIVSGPTLVAFLPSNSKARVDADSTGGGISTAIDDLMFYLGDASDTLAARGVTIHVKIADTLSLATTGPNARRWRWTPAGDSAEIGYYLVSPDRPARVLYGVQVNERLVDAVARHLGAGAVSR